MRLNLRDQQLKIIMYIESYIQPHSNHKPKSIIHMNREKRKESKHNTKSHQITRERA